MRQRRRQHERPGFINDGAVLAAVNAAFRAACGGGLTASVDRRCARRLPKLRPGRRNAAQPDKETFRSPLRRERRSTRRFSGRINTSLPEAASLPGRWIGSGRISARWCLAQARQPRHIRLDRPLPSLTPSGGSPALTPYRSMTPAVDTAKKGIDGGGPVTEAEIESSRAWGSRLLQDPKAAVLRLMDFEMRRVRCRP